MIKSSSHMSSSSSSSSPFSSFLFSDRIDDGVCEAMFTPWRVVVVDNCGNDSVKRVHEDCIPRIAPRYDVIVLIILSRSALS